MYAKSLKHPHKSPENQILLFPHVYRRSITSPVIEDGIKASEIEVRNRVVHRTCLVSTKSGDIPTTDDFGGPKVSVFLSPLCIVSYFPILCINPFPMRRAGGPGWLPGIL